MTPGGIGEVELGHVSHHGVRIGRGGGLSAVREECSCRAAAATTVVRCCADGAGAGAATAVVCCCAAGAEGNTGL